VAPCSGFPPALIDAQVDWRTEITMDRLTLQAQQVSRIGSHQLIGGVFVYRQQKERSCAERIYFPDLDEDFSEENDSVSLNDRNYRVYLRDEFRLSRRLHGVLGIAYDEVQYEDLATEKRTSFNRVSPQVGLSARLGQRSMLRAAAFRNVATDFLGSRISPSTVAGTVIERNEYPTTVRDEASLSIEHALRRFFLAGRVLVRRTDVPAFETDGLEDHTRGAGVAINWALGRRVSLFADDLLLRTRTNIYWQLLTTRTDPYLRTDNVARLGLTFLHERGLRLQATASHFYQRFSEMEIEGLPAEIEGLPRSSHVLLDVDATYEFAAKHGLATLEVRNALDQDFNTALEGLSVAATRPERRVRLTVAWRF
jgi:outer membrane receptor protein involved in Fe transport